MSEIFSSSGTKIKLKAKTQTNMQHNDDENIQDNHVNMLACDFFMLTWDLYMTTHNIL